MRIALCQTALELANSHNNQRLASGQRRLSNRDYGRQIVLCELMFSNSDPGTKIKLRVEPFSSQREFSGRLRDARGIDGEIRAKIQDEGRRIIGTWKDDLGNCGVFSFEKQSPVGSNRR
jgi:hypothetical protein